MDVGAPGHSRNEDRRVHKTRRSVTAAIYLAAFAFVSGGIGGFVAERLTDAADGPTPRSAATATSTTEPTSNLTLKPRSLDISAVLKKVEPGVESITASVTARSGPFISKGTAAGTGIVFDERGDIVTNAHVVEGGTNIHVHAGRRHRVPGGDVGRLGPDRRYRSTSSRRHLGARAGAARKIFRGPGGRRRDRDRKCACTGRGG
jgi:hypothetical protein